MVIASITINWSYAQCMFDITYRIRQQKEYYNNIFRTFYFMLFASYFILQILLMLGLI